MRAYKHRVHGGQNRDVTFVHVFYYHMVTALLLAVFMYNADVWVVDLLI